MRILFLSRLLDMHTALMRSGEFIARTMVARPGKKCYSRTTMWARSIWHSIRKTRGRFMRRSGIRDVHRGAFIRRHTAQGAEYLNQPMVATTGNNLPTDCRPNE